MVLAIAEGAVIADRYRLTRPLGSGSSAVVWEALDTSLGRMVAVKLLHGGAAGHPAGREQLRREAQALGRLSHPRITTVLDYAEHPDEAGEPQPVLVTELLAGQTLEERLERGPLTEADARTAAVQLAEALTAAHAAGIVHRDLKPGNVMLVRDGVKLFDFGIAQSASDTDTTAGEAVGTPACMAPEQLTGRGALPASDVYALGCVLYWSVTGHAPFEGETVEETVHGHLRSTPPELPLRELPPQVAGLYRQCLAKDPTQRPTAATVATVLQPQAAPARPPSNQTLVMPAFEPPPAPSARGGAADAASPGGPGGAGGAGVPGGAGGQGASGGQDGGYPAQPTYEHGYEPAYAPAPRRERGPSRAVLVVGALAIAALAASVTAIVMKGSSATPQAASQAPSATAPPADATTATTDATPPAAASPTETQDDTSSDPGSSPSGTSSALAYLESLKGQINGFIAQGQDTMDPSFGQDLQNSLTSVEASVQAAQQNGFSNRKVREIQSKIDTAVQDLGQGVDGGQVAQDPADSLASELQQLRNAVGSMGGDNGD